ncbi:MAG: sialate O-acetylesterase [Bacteroidota bacterium]
MKRYTTLILLLVQLYLGPQLLSANINLPAFFADHMVLQQNTSVFIWGWGDTNEELTVSCSWDSAIVTTTVNNHASWKVELKTPSAGGPFEIVLRQRDDSLIIGDVLIGEVWLASGQSNMEMTLIQLDSLKKEISGATFPNIRLFQSTKRTAESPQVDLQGEWKPCEPSSAEGFSAVAYFFARELNQKLQIPIGIINSSWGGTGAEVWVNPSVLYGDTELIEAIKMIPENPFGPVDIGTVYHAMIAPLIPLRIAGVIWYQGESNRTNYYVYEKLFKCLIHNWRFEWNHEFPFYFVQITPFNYNEPLVGLMIREAQFNCLTVPNTGMVVTSDIGNVNNAHPLNKKDVGIRLANWALAKTYHQDGIAYSGPLYRAMRIEGTKIRIFFDHSETGLVSRGGALTHFQIAGEDRIFIDAEAEIDGNTVVVNSQEIKKPISVRFAWSNTAEPNLFNMDGLPASCFRTDSWDRKQ